MAGSVSSTLVPTFLQKIQLAFKGWQRRRDEAQRTFVAQNAGWGGAAKTAASAAAPVAASASGAIDLEGLQVAFLDESGLIIYYLDTETGDVMDVRDGSALPNPRYRRVPRRTAASEAEDRTAFVATMEATPMREALAAAVDATMFRKVLSQDRGAERAWYNFKNDRATAAIGRWLTTL
jgi:hypothetical protein